MAFITYRVYTYIIMQMGFVIIPDQDIPMKFINRHEEVTYYAYELIFISFLSYVGYKNSQPDQQTI